jgi:hypothetical protein
MHPDTTIRCANVLDLEGLGKLFDQYRQFYDCVSDLNKARGWLQENLEAGRSTIFVADDGAHFIPPCAPSIWSSISCSTIFMSASQRDGRALRAR